MYVWSCVFVFFLSILRVASFNNVFFKNGNKPFLHICYMEADNEASLLLFCDIKSLLYRLKKSICVRRAGPGQDCGVTGP